MKNITILCIVLFIALGCTYKITVKKPTISVITTSNTQKPNSTVTTSNTQKPVTSVEAQEIFLTFDEAIAISNCAASAEFVSYIEYDDYVEYEFKVKDVLYGDIPENPIHLFSMKGESNVDKVNYNYDLGENIYTKGDEYILIMQRDDYIFYDYPHCMLITDIYIPLKDITKSTMYGQPIKNFTGINSVDEIKKIIKDLSKLENDKVKHLKSEGIKYSKSDKMDEIVAESDLILELKIESLAIEGIYSNGNTYTCDVLKVLKGDKVNKNDDGKIMATLLKNSVKVGESYIIMLNKLGDDSLIYVQSSKKSIIPINDTKSISEIMQILDQ